MAIVDFAVLPPRMSSTLEPLPSAHGVQQPGVEQAEKRLKRNRRAIQNKGMKRPRPYDKKTYQYADAVKKSLGVVYKRLMDASVIQFCLKRVRRAQECIGARTQELAGLINRQIDADQAVTKGLL